LATASAFADERADALFELSNKGPERFAAIRGGGQVYVHCHVGRDRTSLVIALERVLLEGWDAAAAWQHDAVAFGYRPVLFHGNTADSFKAAVAALAPPSSRN
jgi:hypothetical protein